MSHDPYLPPRSIAADPEPPPLPVRPRNVNIALSLIGVAILIQGLADMRLIQQADFHVDEPVVMAMSFAWLLLIGFLCHQMARARNWARVAFLAMTLLTFIDLCSGVGEIIRRMPDLIPKLLEATFLLTRALPLILSLIALHLLFYSSGSWFRTRAN